MQLHALLDDCYVQHADARIRILCLPSKGFISASLDIVAAAPLAAIFKSATLLLSVLADFAYLPQEDDAPRVLLHFHPERAS